MLVQVEWDTPPEITVEITIDSPNNAECVAIVPTKATNPIIDFENVDELVIWGSKTLPRKINVEHKEPEHLNLSPDYIQIDTDIPSEITLTVPEMPKINIEIPNIDIPLEINFPPIIFSTPDIKMPPPIMARPYVKQLFQATPIPMIDIGTITGNFWLDR